MSDSELTGEAGDNPAGRATRALQPRKPEKDAEIDDFNSTPGSILLRVAGLPAANPATPKFTKLCSVKPRTASHITDHQLGC